MGAWGLAPIRKIERKGPVDFIRMGKLVRGVVIRCLDREGDVVGLHGPLINNEMRITPSKRSTFIRFPHHLKKIVQISYLIQPSHPVHSFTST